MSTITLNPNKPSSFDFDVTISGLDNNTPIVRFVIDNFKDSTHLMVDCEKIDPKNKKSKWKANFPILEIDENNRDFRIEVIVDEYYFVPCTGTINFITTPEVNISTNKKPKVSATISVDEGAECSSITGQYAPTNNLLKPEYPPIESKSKTPRTEPLDDLINLDDLSSSITPGTGAQYAQKDPDEIANKILGNNAPVDPTKKRSLFSRDSSGKPIVPGLESKQQKDKIKNNSQIVSDILK